MEFAQEEINPASGRARDPNCPSPNCGHPRTSHTGDGCGRREFGDDPDDPEQDTVCPCRLTYMELG